MARPTDLSEEQLGFRKQHAVRWLDPRVLIRTGMQSMISEMFGAYADKRELQGTLPPTTGSAGGETGLWFDFVADLGDGFDATYSVASLLAAPELLVTGVEEPLPRGQLLVMGGDQAYPAAGTTAYEERTKGVYRAALPVAPPVPALAPKLYALPGNHDWYDGLTSFLRVFAQQRNFGGWETEQTRSYFAIALPKNWWLFAIDTQFDDYVDKPQLDYFRSVGLEKGDAVILCTSKPSWLPAGSNGTTKGHDTIEFFLREVIPSGVTVPLMLTGDKHHYAHYADGDKDAERRLITCGLGGAYLSSTHRLRPSLTLPPSGRRASSAPRTYDLKARYPDEGESKRLARGVFRLPWRNWMFLLLTGVLQMVTSLAVLFGLGETVDPTREGSFSLVGAWAPTAILAAVLYLAGVAFARRDVPKKKNRAQWWFGFLHAVPHLGLSTGWAFFVHWLHGDVLPAGECADWWTFGIFVVATPTVIGFLDAEIVAVYLWFASMGGFNSNELFAAQRIEDHKGFLRMHIDEKGELKIYPVALPQIGRQWNSTPDPKPTDPWFVPEPSLKSKLIEGPIEIPHP